MPVLTPAELWEATGRIKIPEIFHLQDRTGRRFILPLTHEETVTFHAREIQLVQGAAAALVPLPDEGPRRAARPRRPAPRPRVHHEGRVLVRPRRGGRRRGASRRTAAAYKRIFERCGLETYDVQAESGIMGGKFSVDFLAPVGLGREHARHAARTATTRPTSRSRGRFRAPPSSRSRSSAPEEVETPGVTTIEGLAEFLGIDAAATSKAMPVVKDDGTLVLALVRGDDRLERDEALRRAAGASRPRPTRRSAPPSARAEARSARSGSRARSSPTRRCAKGSSSPARTGTAGTCAASRPAATTSPRFADLREPREGDRCPECGGALQLPDRDRGRAHLQLRQLLLRAARGDVPRRGRPGEAAPRRQLRHRPRPRDGRHRRAAPRRARDRVAGSGRAVRRPRRRARRGWRSRRSASPSASRRAGSTSSSTTATLRAGREVRRRRPDRRPDARHRRQEDARGRRGRRAATARPARSAA